jgi:hypothetical protein
MVSKTQKRALRLKQRKDEVQQQRKDAAIRRRNKKIINIVLIVVVVVAAAAILFSLFKPEKDDPRLERFAKCLTANGAGMYGTDSCPSCQEQKRVFGKAFKYVAYINCEFNTAACENDEIRGYPTWVFKGGEQNVGLMSINELSEQTGCVFE